MPIVFFRISKVFLKTGAVFANFKATRKIDVTVTLLKL